MTRPEPCQVTLLRMGIGSVAFPLTVVRAPFTDVRCRTNSPAPRKTSSSVVRLLKKRVNRLASSPKSSANKESARERKAFDHDPGVHEVCNAGINGSNYNDDSTEQRFSRSEGPDCQEFSKFGDCEATETGGLEGTSKATSKWTENIPGEYKTSRADTTCHMEVPKNQINTHRSKRLIKRKKGKWKSLTSMRRSPTKGSLKKLMNIKATGHNPDGHISKDQTIISTQKPGNKYLQVQKLRATYNPKGSCSRDCTQVLRLPNLTSPIKNLKGHLKANKVSPWKQKNEEKKILKESPSVSSRRQLLTSNFPADGTIVKIYLSESHSEIITGAPSAPPGSPTADQLKAVQYVQSLMDIKSQRAVKAKLTTIGNKMRLKEQRWKEKTEQEEHKRAHHALLQLRERQRAEIYALNKVMTELENENFKKFMNQQEDGASVQV